MFRPGSSSLRIIRLDTAYNNSLLSQKFLLNVRLKSTTAAINKGLIRSRQWGRRQNQNRGREKFELPPVDWGLRSKDHNSDKQRSELPKVERGLRSKLLDLAEEHGEQRKQDPGDPSWERRRRTADDTAIKKKRPRGSDEIAEPTLAGVKYTSATSEFIYGNSTVRAALKVGRRKMHNLYLHPRATSSSSSPPSAAARSENRLLLRSAEKLGINVINVDDRWLKIMDSMTKERPHNGIILETEPLVLWRAAALEPHDPTLDTEPGQQSTFGIAPSDDNIPPLRLPYFGDGWRMPFVLLIDDVVSIRVRSLKDSCSDI